jgi:putative peptidoglycan lipid II flippase
VKGIAAATAVASWINVGQMAFGLSRKNHYSPSLATWSRVARILAASVAMGGALAAASHWRPLIEAPLRELGLRGHTLGAKEAALLLTVLVGGALYPPLVFLFGGVTPAELKGVLKRGRG